MTKVTDLKPGDAFDHWTYSIDLTMPVRVTVLKHPKVFIDRFGREMIRFWARREDMGAEGWMEFGPSMTLATEPTDKEAR